MKIFISWSGELSHKVAKDLKDWFGCVLQGVDSFVSSEDIRKGQRWAFDIAKELDESNFGIICLTQDNLNAPWILFESGALSKSVKETNVSTLLINGVEVSDITGPLSQFQHTTVSKDDFQKLVLTINEKLGEKRLSDETTKKVFEKWWPDLETKIQMNIKNTNRDAPVFEKRSDREIIVETLELARFLANRSAALSDHRSLSESVNSVIRTDGEFLISPSGGELNHLVQVRVFPVPVQGKIISVTISNNGIQTSEITPPFDTRGVIIELTFYSETDAEYWEAKFQFHKGNTLVETCTFTDEEMNKFPPEVIWRD